MNTFSRLKHVQVEEVSAMRSFVEYLTSEMHLHVKHAEVIWFDSVTSDGKLNWQNELNDDNRCRILCLVTWFNFK